MCFAADDGYFYEKVRQMRPRSLLSVYLVSLAYKALPILIRLQWDGQALTFAKPSSNTGVSGLGLSVIRQIRRSLSKGAGSRHAHRSMERQTSIVRLSIQAGSGLQIRRHFYHYLYSCDVKVWTRCILTNKHLYYGPTE